MKNTQNLVECVQRKRFSPEIAGEEKGRGIAGPDCFSRRVGRSLTVLFIAVAAVTGCGGGGGGDVTPGPAVAADADVAVDLAKQLSSARVLTEHTEIHFGEDSDHARMMSGWGRFEVQLGRGTPFAWANAEASEIIFDVASSEKRRLEISAWPFQFPDAPDQAVELFVNGTAIDRVGISPKRRKAHFDIPAGILLPGRNLLRFEYAYVGSPQAERSDSKDRRRLAVGFEKIRLAPGATPVGTGPFVRAADGEIRQAVGTAVVSSVVGPRDGLLSVGADLEGANTAEVWLRPEEGEARRLLRFDGTDPLEAAVTADVSDMAGKRFDLVLSAQGESGEVRWLKPRIFGAPVKVERPPNVVLVVIDTLRGDALGIYGGDAATPNIDRLAREGVVFDRATAHIPITGPSHSSMFTSRFVFQHGVLNNASLLRTDFETLAEIYHEAGRKTAGFVSLGVLHHDYGFDQGFEVYGDFFARDWMKSADEVLAEVDTWLDDSFLDPFFLWVHFSEPHEPYSPPGLDYPEVKVLLDGEEVGRVVADGRGYPSRLMFPEGESRLRLELVERAPDKVFRVLSARIQGGGFTLVPGSGLVGKESPHDNVRTILQTHFPAEWTVQNPGKKRGGILQIQCSERLALEELRRRYRLEVEAVDAAVGRLMDRLEALGHADNAVVVVVSDHGEGLGDHGLVGHIEQVFDSLVKVPLVLWAPGRIPAGVRVEEAVSMIDLAPTLADLSGVRSPEGAVGRSLVDSWEKRIDDRPIVVETHRPEAGRNLVGLVWRGHKLIRRPDVDRPPMLFDLRADPEELNDIAGARPDLVGMLGEKLDELLAGGGLDRVAAELTDEEKEQLKALGYVH